MDGVYKGMQVMDGFQWMLYPCSKFTDRFVPNALVSNIKHEKKKKGETGFGPDSGLSDTRQTYRSSMRASDARLDR